MSLWIRSECGIPEDWNIYMKNLQMRLLFEKNSQACQNRANFLVLFYCLEQEGTIIYTNRKKNEKTIMANSDSCPPGVSIEKFKALSRLVRGDS